MRIVRMMGLAPAGFPSRTTGDCPSRDRDVRPEPRLDAARGVVLGLGLSLTAWTALGLVILGLC